MLGMFLPGAGLVAQLKTDKYCGLAGHVDRPAWIEIDGDR